MKSSGNLVLAKLPRAGLGNKLLVWAHAKIFGHLNDIDVFSTNWITFHIGPYLRKEKNKRFYYGYFNHTSLINKIKIKYHKLFYKSQYEPKVEQMNFSTSGNVFIFHEIPHWSDHFQQIRQHRDYVKEEIYSKLITEQVKREVNQYESPEIGVHIRMGDFNFPVEDKSIQAQGMVRTPLSFFIRQINNIRKFVGEHVKATVFSDGFLNELVPILELPNVEMAPPKSDIIDLLLLSKSKIILTSRDSTFSYWGVFLSDAICMHHLSYQHRLIRPSTINDIVFEGAVEDNTELWPDRLKSELLHCQLNK